MSSAWWGCRWGRTQSGRRTRTLTWPSRLLTASSPNSTLPAVCVRCSSINQDARRLAENQSESDKVFVWHGVDLRAFEWMCKKVRCLWWFTAELSNILVDLKDGVNWYKMSILEGYNSSLRLICCLGDSPFMILDWVSIIIAFLLNGKLHLWKC